MKRLTRRDETGDAIISALSDMTADLYTGLGDNEQFLTDALNKLAAYEDAEEQGRLIVLPCKVGDELWFEKNGQLRCETIDRINLDQTDDDEEPFCSIYTMSVSCLFEDIGRLVWITRKEAEEALEGMK